MKDPFKHYEKVCVAINAVDLAVLGDTDPSRLAVAESAKRVLRLLAGQYWPPSDDPG